MDVRQLRRSVEFVADCGAGGRSLPCTIDLAVDGCSLRCPLLRSVTLSDGEYYEMVKSNFERADRATVVRTTTNYTTSLVPLLSAFKDLLFN